MSMEPEVLTEWVAPLYTYRITSRADEYGVAVHALERRGMLDGAWQIVNPSEPHHAAVLIQRVIRLSPPLQITCGQSLPRGSFVVTDGAAADRSRAITSTRFVCGD